MQIEQHNNSVILTFTNSPGRDSSTGINIGETLESGQCFRFQALGEGCYKLQAFGRNLTIRQAWEHITFEPCTVEEFKTLWQPYFDLERDYAHVMAQLSANDPVMAKAAAYAGGVHILRQEPWECLISFIISQNNHIKRIKGIIDKLCRAYGTPTQDGFDFPTPQQLIDAGLDGLLSCGTGFRAKYMLDAAQKVQSGALSLEGLKQMPTALAKEKLMEVYGIGNKVADCVLLFSCGHMDVFPIDVWVRRIMLQAYFHDQTVTDTHIKAFAQKQFGQHAGIAQQLLFHYARTCKDEERNIC